MSYATPEPPPFPEETPAFVADLTTWKNLKPHWNCTAQGFEDELDLHSGFQIQQNYPDPEAILSSAYEHLRRFMGQAQLPTTGQAVLRTEQDVQFSREDFALEVTAQEIIISGGTTEAIRRGLYFLEEELASAPRMALKKGRQVKHFWLHNRISRCFFGPIKRPPFNRDELLDEIDYYPEAYLDQLAREGINGLWLTLEFKEVCHSSLRPDDPRRERRLAKLRRAVERCRQYGIKIWAFAIEPRAWGAQNPLPAAHPELAGAPTAGGERYFCPGTPAAQQYLYEATYSLFSAVPHLGGLLLISHGEMETSCLSEASPMHEARLSCPRHAHTAPGEVLRQVLSPLRRGMRDAAPEAELISWLYQPQPDQFDDWVFELPTALNEDIILAYNFESGCRKEQLGKLRNGGDYWLSCVGPSERFGRLAQAAQGHCQLAAKLQVGCSHEVATIPYVPVPGLLYRKYKAMRQLGVAHVMQCWYFGNYPGVMNLAAGHLACEDFADDETKFLTRLARPEWGKYAPEVAAVWQKLGAAYEHYPLGYEFQYYGPMHDGPVWPLHLYCCHGRLPRTWLPETFAAGDAIGESLINFDINEAVILSQQLAQLWQEGTQAWRQIAAKFPDDVARQMDLNVAEALECQFQSGADILLFYQRRNKLINSGANDVRLVAELQAIAERELTVSQKLLELTQRDPRLGYHSEAEVYKYFPAKLAWRIGTLKHLLAEEFPAVCRELKHGLTPQAVLASEPETWALGQNYSSKTFQWRAELVAGELILRLEFDTQTPTNWERDNFMLFIDDRLGAFRPRSIEFNLTQRTFMDTLEVAKVYWSKAGTALKCQVRIPLYSLRDTDGCRLGMLRYSVSGGQPICESCPAGDYDNDYRLQHGFNLPERTRFLPF